MSEKIKLDVGDRQMDFQTGNFLNAIHQVVVFFSIGGGNISNQSLVDVLELYARMIKDGEL